MDFDEVANLLHRKPFVPIRAGLDDGEKFVVAAPLRAIVSEGKLLVGWSKDPYVPLELRRLRIIPENRVQTIDDVDPIGLRPRPRR